MKDTLLLAIFIAGQYEIKVTRQKPAAEEFVLASGNLVGLALLRVVNQDDTYPVGIPETLKPIVQLPRCRIVRQGFDCRFRQTVDDYQFRGMLHH